MYKHCFKRILDILCALVMLVCFSWLYLILAILVRTKLGSPVIFSQERPGMIDPKTGKEKIFKLYKFRSMADLRDENGDLLPDDQRLTRFGRALRATSLDELPEAWNILKGDMSLIGPRPLLVRYLDRYTPEQRRRHTVKPGLSGYAQVHGRNAISWEEKFALDLYYVDHISFWLDMKIILDTVLVVLRKDDVNASETVTMEEFMGTAQKEEETVS